MALSSSVLASLAIGVPSVILSGATYVFGTRAHRDAMSQKAATVDAAAYDRAKMLYESAITTMQTESAELRAEVIRLRADVAAMGVRMLALSAENRALEERIRVVGGDDQSDREGPVAPP